MLSRKKRRSDSLLYLKGRNAVSEYLVVPLLYGQRMGECQPIAVNLEIGRLAVSRPISLVPPEIDELFDNVLGGNQKQLQCRRDDSSLCYRWIQARHRGIFPVGSLKEMEDFPSRSAS